MTPNVVCRAVAPLLFFSPFLQASASSVDPQVEACIRENAPKTTAIQKIELRSTDRIGSEKILVADLYLKRFANESTGLIAYFKEPEDLRGTRLLIIEKAPINEMYLYMPALFKIRRITSKRISSSMYGSDFSYEDLERLYGMLSSEAVEQKADALLMDKRCTCWLPDHRKDRDPSMNRWCPTSTRKPVLPGKWNFSKREPDFEKCCW